MGHSLLISMVGTGNWEGGTSLFIMTKKWVIAYFRMAENVTFDKKHGKKKSPLLLYSHPPNTPINNVFFFKYMSCFYYRSKER